MDWDEEMVSSLKRLSTDYDYALEFGEFEFWGRQDGECWRVHVREERSI